MTRFAIAGALRSANFTKEVSAEPKSNVPKRAPNGDKVKDPSAIVKQTTAKGNSQQESNMEKEDILAMGNLQRQWAKETTHTFTGPSTSRNYHQRPQR